MKNQVMDNGTLRDATPEEETEIQTRQSTTYLPESVEILNLILILIEDGHLAKLETEFAKLTGKQGQRARAQFTRGRVARRNTEWVNIMWPMLYANEAAFNDAWRRAAALDV